jgi:hypothetical protein
MFAMVLVLPCVRAFRKYHTLSFLMGPPKDPFRSYTLLIGVGACRPASLMACVKLSDSSFSPVPVKKMAPEFRLPPVFGTRFITRPAVSCSPRPPEVVNEISCAFPTSAT